MNDIDLNSLFLDCLLLATMTPDKQQQRVSKYQNKWSTKKVSIGLAIMEEYGFLDRSESAFVITKSGWQTLKIVKDSLQNKTKNGII